MKFAYVLLMLLSFNSLASNIGNLNKYGEGQMSVLFWDLYNAELFGSLPNYKENTSPLALKLTYLRDIDKQDLIEATAEQWQHIEMTNPKAPVWLTRLDGIWFDIKKGDSLTLKIHANGTSSFYGNGEKLGDIDDPEFGSSFVAIWLSPNTSAPKLRQKLIGEVK